MSDLPKTPPAPAGAYQAVLVHDGLGFVSAQFPFRDGRLVYAGRVGAELTEEEGRAAAELAALNVLAQIEAALGSLDRVATLLRVEGHIASVAGWHGHPRVLDGASETFLRYLGERGRHTRTAFAPERLPVDAAVELVVTFAVTV